MHLIGQHLRSVANLIHPLLGRDMIGRATAPVEGHVNWLKHMKRSMYGRAKLPLLRACVLLCFCPRVGEPLLKGAGYGGPICLVHLHFSCS